MAAGRDGAGIADNTPVLVGAGQFTERVDAPDYKGLPPYAIAAQAMPFIKSGKVRALAMTTDRRLKTLPDVPLMQEVVPGFDPAPAWTGIYGPARLPPAVQRRLHDDINRSLSIPDVVSKINDVGFDVVLSATAEEFAQRMKKGIDLTARIVKAAKIEPQ